MFTGIDFEKAIDYYRKGKEVIVLDRASVGKNGKSGYDTFPFEAIVKEPEVGEIYNGLVKTIQPFGAFVEILPGKDGLCHISKLANHRVEKVEDVVKEGDWLKVKVMEVDKKTGKISLSHKDAIEEGEE